MNEHKGNINTPWLELVHVLRDFSFKDIGRPDSLNKSTDQRSVVTARRKMLIDIMNDHGLGQLVISLSRSHELVCSV